MANMKAAIYTGIREIEVRQVERSRPEAGQVLLDTRCTGICGSDLHSYFGTWGQSHTTAAGHETCGVVAEVGAGVTGFAVGDTVAVECFSPLWGVRVLHHRPVQPLPAPAGASPPTPTAASPNSPPCTLPACSSCRTA